MDIDLELTDCTEDMSGARGKKPLTLREAGTERLTNRRILKRASKGSYGAGGCGFFGILLDSNADYPKEWLFLALWGSNSWLLLDGVRLDSLLKITRMPGGTFFALLCNVLGRLSIILLPILTLQYRLFQLVRPLWDGDWKKLVGSVIDSVEISESKSLIKVKRGKNFSVLEVPVDSIRKCTTERKQKT